MPYDLIREVRQLADQVIIGDTSKIVGSKATSTATKKDNPNSLGKDDFLKILITQLQNQDPMQPLEDKEFIAQMAQFTSVEQLTNMSNELHQLPQMLGFASGLIGKTVSWNYTDETGTTKEKSGVVNSIVYKDGTQYAVVNGEQISLDRLTKVGNGGNTQ
jgi:flagellar basal-body rod modification protein FlgD